MLSKNIELVHAEKGFITFERDKKRVFCPFQVMDLCCGSWCPHFNIQPTYTAFYGNRKIDSPPDGYKVALGCKGTAFSVNKEQLEKIGLI